MHATDKQHSKYAEVNFPPVAPTFTAECYNRRSPYVLNLTHFRSYFYKAKWSKFSQLSHQVCYFCARLWTDAVGKWMFRKFSNIPGTVLHRSRCIILGVSLVITSCYQSQCNKCFSFVFSRNPGVSLNIPDPSTGDLKERKDKAMIEVTHNTIFIFWKNTQHLTSADIIALWELQIELHNDSENKQVLFDTKMHILPSH